MEGDQDQKRWNVSVAILVLSYLARLCLFFALGMSDSQQDLLRRAWTEGRTGTLSALSEAKAWALREVWRSEGNGEWGLMKFVAERVTK